MPFTCWVKPKQSFANNKLSRFRKIPRKPFVFLILFLCNLRHICISSMRAVLYFNAWNKYKSHLSTIKYFLRNLSIFMSSLSAFKFLILTEQPEITFLIKLLCNFIEITLRHRHFHVNLLHIFRTSFTKNTSGRLPLIAVTTETCRQRCSLKKVFLTVPEIRFIKIARYRPAILLTLSWREPLSYRNQSIEINGLVSIW